MERKKSKTVRSRISKRKKLKKVTSSTDERFNKERAIKEELVRLTQVVRGKYKDLRRNTDDIERYFEASAKPLVSPLKKSVVEGIQQSMPLPMVDIKKEKVKKKKKQKQEVKEEEEDETDLDKTADVSVQTDDELIEQYLKKLSTTSYRAYMDTSYGVRLDGRGGMLIGDSPIVFTKTKTIVKGEKFNITPGLMELLMMKEPDPAKVTNDDLTNYRDILLLTNAHRQMYSAEKPINATKGVKYTKVIAKLFPPAYAAAAAASSTARITTPTAKKKATEKTSLLSGSGIVRKRYTTNANALVNRLRLLTLSEAAGHTAHSEEIAEIIDLLRLHRLIV